MRIIGLHISPWNRIKFTLFFISRIKISCPEEINSFEVWTTDTILRLFISQIFGVFERNRASLHLEDYSVSQTTLEQVFMDFAKSQLPSRQEMNLGCLSACKYAVTQDKMVRRAEC